MTRRSRFLDEALRSFETGDALTLFDLANDLSIETTLDYVESLSDDDNRVLNEMAAQLRQAQGEVLRNQRLSLIAHPKPDMGRIVVDHFKRLSSDGRKIMVNAYREVLSGPRDHDNSAVESSELEAFDARYARELIDLLPGVVAKASSLQQLEITRIPKASVQRYFDEAHRCYFFGLNRACVILCRAILEAALKEILGSNHRTHELLELAGKPRGDGTPPLLEKERLDSAERIFSGGNSAVHHEHIFYNNYSDAEVDNVLIDMRKILADIYCRSKGMPA